jgi:hypothetical protein
MQRWCSPDVGPTFGQERGLFTPSRAAEGHWPPGCRRRRRSCLRRAPALSSHSKPMHTSNHRLDLPGLAMLDRRRRGQGCWANGTGAGRQEQGGIATHCRSRCARRRARRGWCAWGWRWRRARGRSWCARRPRCPPAAARRCPGRPRRPRARARPGCCPAPTHRPGFGAPGQVGRRQHVRSFARHVWPGRVPLQSSLGLQAVCMRRCPRTTGSGWPHD